ncbi:MAG: ferritin-like domain-containing protein [bacterium]
MTNQEIVDRLSSLMKLDIDAVKSYGQAIEEIDISDVRQQVTQFRDDHNRHITDLSNMIREFGGTPPRYSVDMRGFFMEGFTAIRSLTGTAGALKALHTNEEITNKGYLDAHSLEMSPSVMELIEKNFADEQRHLSYITQAINNKIWEKR